jgi:hypothetical protein
MFRLRFPEQSIVLSPIVVIILLLLIIKTVQVRDKAKKEREPEKINPVMTVHQE